MRTLFRIVNILLIVAIVACCAGALAGMIVFLPIVAGAWLLDLVGLLGFEQSHGAPRRERPRLAAGEPEPVRVTSPEPRGSIPMTHGI
jgi:hypothetical protein